MTALTYQSVKLSIVIPTYKRYSELSRCLASVYSEIASLDIDYRRCIEVLIGDNRSPKSTAALVGQFDTDASLVFIRRNENVGAFNNLLDLTFRAAGEFVLWLTDDDMLIEGSLRYILGELRRIDSAVGFIWGPLPTFDARNMKLFTIESESFPESTVVQAGSLNSSAHANVAWAISRQIYRKSAIDFEAVRKIDNAYFPIFIAARVMLNCKSLFLKRPYVLHSYYNDEHWEEWGQDELLRKLRIFCDGLTVMEIGIKPDTSDVLVLENIRKHRAREIEGYLKSEIFQRLLDRDGPQVIMRKIEELLNSFPHVLKEVFAAFDNHSIRGF